MRLHDFSRPCGDLPLAGPAVDHAAAACALSHEDRHALIDALARFPDHDPWVLAMARAKVALARVYAAADLPADRVSIGSRIAFGIAERGSETAVLAPWDEAAAPLGRIALRTRLGVALLGTREGSIVTVPRHDGTREPVAVHAILYRPRTGRQDDASAANDNGSDGEARR